MTKTRKNHYVPEWYQKGFQSKESSNLFYLDLNPKVVKLPDGRSFTHNSLHSNSTSKCFYQTDLYTTFFGSHINDEVEKYLFGEIDRVGAAAVRAYTGHDLRKQHELFREFFLYINAQMVRTPKGLDWLKQSYPDLSQIDLMVEMQELRHLHCAYWTEGVRELVSAEGSETKFIVSDHPVTVYNHACPSNDQRCVYPNDPSIALKASQTIFCLNENVCLILTNLEYAQHPANIDPLEQRTNAKPIRQSLVRTDSFIRTRKLNSDEVVKINYIIKNRARRYIAASNKEWLYPEKHVSTKWSDLKDFLLPQHNELYRFGGEIFVGQKDGTTLYQDQFGRSTPQSTFLEKSVRGKLQRNDPCGCGSGKKFKKCCEGKSQENRPSWKARSIRERNLILYNAVYDILGLDKGKDWNDVRKEFSNEHVKKIHEVYGLLWNRETDLLSLLPKPDNSLRAIYSGQIDPRTVPYVALACVPYFDEVLIQHPFINPNGVKPQFSPTHVPDEHRYQTLKNICLFLCLEPFVRQGIVNFFPDPCVFDGNLQRQMFDMASSRRGKSEINKKEENRFTALFKDDFLRGLKSLPSESLRYQIRKAMPELTADEVEAQIEYIEKERQKDPFILLEGASTGNSSQFMFSHLAPNYEMSLYLAQVTGSIIITDSETRWEELNANKMAGEPSHNKFISGIVEAFSGLEIPLNSDLEYNFISSVKGMQGNFRKTLREVASLLKSGSYNLSEQFVDRIVRDLKNGIDSKNGPIAANTNYSYSLKMHPLLIEGGIIEKNVQRLLIQSGSECHLRSAPLALFLETIEPVVS